jgi:hypothetical protein
MGEFGITAAVLPELEALRGVGQSVYHHRDVYEHTLEVLDATVLLARDPAAAGLPGHAPELVALLEEPLAEGSRAGRPMRFAALLHDIAKPQTRRERADGRGAGFPGTTRKGRSWPAPCSGGSARPRSSSTMSSPSPCTTCGSASSCASARWAHGPCTGT